MNINFDWNLVRSFLAALDHGSLLGAARALGASQPTLGRHIAELEAQLGTVLFERTRFQSKLIFMSAYLLWNLMQLCRSPQLPTISTPKARSAS